MSACRALPLTVAQTWAWQLHQEAPESPACQVAGYLDVLGEVDLSVLAAALRTAAADADALCVRFESGRNGVRQVVDRTLRWPLPVVDVRGEPDPIERAHAWMNAETLRPMDLTSGPPFRFAVLRVAGDRCFVHFCLHHAAIDGFGFRLVLDRILEVYTAMESAQPVPPSPLGSLSALVEEDVRYHASDELTRDRRYWRDQVPDMAAARSLSGADERTTPAARFLREADAIPPTTGKRLRALARDMRASLSVIAMVALGIHSCTLAGSGEHIVEVPVSGRRGRIARGVPGMVASALPLRLRTRRDMTVGDLVRHAVERVRELLRHQRYPFVLLPEDLGISDIMAVPQPPVINVIGYERAMWLGSHRAALQHLSNGPVEDFAFNVYPRSDGTIQVDCNANPKLYAPGDLSFHHRRFVEILWALADAEPDTTVVDAVGAAA